MGGRKKTKAEIDIIDQHTREWKFDMAEIRKKASI